MTYEELSFYIRRNTIPQDPISLKIKTDDSTKISHLEFVLNDNIDKKEVDEFTKELNSKIESIVVHYI